LAPQTKINPMSFVLYCIVAIAALELALVSLGKLEGTNVQWVLGLNMGIKVGGLLSYGCGCGREHRMGQEAEAKLEGQSEKSIAITNCNYDCN